jgi:hypothetical protein
MSTAARFVHIGFSSAPPVKELEDIFNSALDWLRYDNRCWILYTTTELDEWRDRIKKVLDDVNGLQPPTAPKPKGVTFLLFEINVDTRSGYATEFVWEWLSKARSS